MTNEAVINWVIATMTYARMIAAPAGTDRCKVAETAGADVAELVRRLKGNRPAEMHMNQADRDLLIDSTFRRANEILATRSIGV